MFCKYCGAQLPKNAKFCAGCGARVSAPARQKGGARLAAAGLAGVLALALAILTARQGMGRPGGADAYTYLTGDGELMYMADLRETTKPVRLADGLDFDSLRPRFSPDGQTVYFTDPDGALWAVCAPEAKQGGKPECISREAGSYVVLDDGRVLYTAGGDHGVNFDLRLRGGEEDFCLVRGCCGYRLSEDQTHLYYTQLGKTPGTEALYRMPLEKNAKGEQLIREAQVIYSDWDAEVLVYGVPKNVGSGLFTVCSCLPGGEETVLAEEVSSVTLLSAEKDNLEFYYNTWTWDSEGRTLYDYVTDTRKEQDAALLQEEPPVQPSLDGRLPTGIRVLDDDTIEYRTEEDGWRPYDVGHLLSAKYPTAWVLYRDTDLIENDLTAELRAQYNKKNAAYEAYREAAARQALRQELMDTPDSQIISSVYHYTGGPGGAESVLIVAGVELKACAISPEDGLFLCPREGAEWPKLADVAELSDVNELYTLMEVERGSTGGGWRMILNGQESEIGMEDVTGIPYLAVLNGEEVVAELVRGDERTLQSFTLDGGRLTAAGVIAEGSFGMPYLASVSGRDAVCLFTGMKPDSNGYFCGDFCVYQDGSLQTVAEKVYEAMALENGDVYVSTDIDVWDSSQDLALVEDGKLTAIADGVSRWNRNFLRHGRILYLRRGSLYLWDGKKERQIARDVEDLWVSAEEPYERYFAG